MKNKLTFIVSITIFLFSCGNVEKLPANEEPAITGEEKSDSSVSAETVPAAAVESYLNQLEYGKIKFIIKSAQSTTANAFTVVPTGLTISNDSITMDAEGIIIKSEVGDLDGDNSPELLVVAQSGPDKKGKAYIFSANKNKSISMVSLPDISSDPKNITGYAGNDEFALVESRFSHRFPLYENGQPINKTRQFQYKLKPGEAMKKLVLDKTIEY